MIDVTCPKCGGMGRAPREKVNTRLVCKKCRATFYISSSGRTMLGEPPAPGKDEHARGRAEAGTAKPATDWRDNLPEFIVTGRSAIIAVVAVVVAVVGYWFFSLPPERLEDRAKIVAQSFADGNLDALKGDSLNGTADDLVQWYGQAHPKFESLRKEWAGQDVLVGVLVIEENKRASSGQVTAILAPSKPSKRDASLHGAADMAGLSSKSMELMFQFTPDVRGRWRVDGKKMNNSRSGQQL